MHTKLTLTTIVLVLCLLAACGPSEADLAATDDAIAETEEAQSAATESARRTSEAATQAYETDLENTAQAETAQAETAQAEAEAATATAAFRATQTSVSATQEQATVVARTAEASRIFEIVQELYDEGYINRTEGSFQQLPSYSDAWAQIGWFQTIPIQDSFSSDFVLVMDVSWESASRSAEFWRSGCGIAFRVADDISEYYTFMLGLDGNMNFFPKLASSNTVYLSKAWYGNIEHMEGSATFIVTAEGSQFQVFDENLRRVDLRNGADLVNGYMAYILASGINTDFGTRCTFVDTDLWRLDD